MKTTTESKEFTIEEKAALYDKINEEWKSYRSEECDTHDFDIKCINKYFYFKWSYEHYLDKRSAATAICDINEQTCAIAYHSEYLHPILKGKILTAEETIDLCSLIAELEDAYNQ